MSIFFISDVHLAPDRPDITEHFTHYVSTLPASAQRLYIVGDLFEAWIGDDAPGALGEHVMEELAKISDKGVQGFFTHGNRDFLIGERFSQQTGFTLLGERELIECYGYQVLLLHGDCLCTDDTEYQVLRKTVRDPQWQQNILELDVAQRLALAQKMRQASQQEMQRKAEYIMDVNAQTVADAFTEFEVGIMLHGHTHRPMVHTLELNNRSCTRIVLGDWYDQGSSVTWDANGFVLHKLKRPS